MAIGKRADDESIKRLRQAVTISSNEENNGDGENGHDPVDEDSNSGQGPLSTDWGSTAEADEVEPEPPAPPETHQTRLTKPLSEEERLERQQILEALERYQWNRRKTAQSLGISYQTLRRRILKYELDS